MLSSEDNELLCRVVGDAPMGQLMRRFWMPVCLVEEVSEPDGTPVRARVLGEDLVVFRDTDGRVGVMDERCPHRRASLVYGRNEECGLRCLYHGWKMDVDGNVVDMASQPASKRMLETIKHRAYPVREWGGFVWSYLGSAESIPEFVPPPWAPREDARVSIAKVIIPCNWAQVLEGAIDSSHSSSLHSSDMVPAQVTSAEATDNKWFRPSYDKAPRLQVERTGYGFRYVALRRPNRDEKTHVYARSSVYIAPATVLIPPNTRYNVANVNVPRDDESTAFYFIGWGHPSRTPETETWRKFLGAQVGVDLDEQYRPYRNVDNHFWQDREMMKAGNFTGITGFPNQDIAMWVTMGAIADRTREQLGSSDLAIMEFRQQMVEALRDFMNGSGAIGTGGKAIPDGICSFQAIMPKEVDWRDFDTGYVWEPSAAREEELEPSYSTPAQ